MKVLSVSELTFAIKSVLEPPFRGVSVRGEISNFKLQTSGHLYFSLKDAGSQISAVLFKGNAASLPRLPKEGDQVVATGEISLYAPRGQYQIVIRELQFAGVGELLLKLEQLKTALQVRGWFDQTKKKPLPKLPRRIGVVTSPTGAVIQDILNVLTRRFAGCQILLNPVKVQGDGAAQEIAQAINDFNKYNLADVLIVGRGGGSIEDLWAFNEEVVAKAIFESKIPIISAVGHETDFTIADWVADVRAPTPSAAAEIVIAEKLSLLKFLEQTRQALGSRLSNQIRAQKVQLSSLKKHPLFSSPYTLLSHPIQKLDALRSELELLKPSNQIAQLKERLALYAPRFQLSIKQRLERKKEQSLRLQEHLRSLHPQKLLKQGYSLVFANGRLVRSANDLKTQDALKVQLHDGELQATINQVSLNDTRNESSPALF